ncbi:MULTISPECIES: dihydroneopterin triphosphate 2'-epimerase [Pseudoalteromonas]|uniref:Dihydroneopterin triphosphate 2'-epimerase n=2 Tax=Pseudoalteromonas TaxID=53246 RepID=A0A0F4QJQ4_9GAMM|nr:MULTISPECIES: dihydroneopterin triphosphate 2'-epimerase [Pseudoalteromonas]KJZ07490.1 D-erythro-7,8-dihydroneopterin triphosphate epimerase [Pseudoalteromonas rubra]MCF2910901.1 dihydroneopterin triphosphate 2'-epimerase [Pseudoalteromonas sp. DL2-H2.2]QTL36585.1 dihydroneopterin triphosphate 2'-epimerase [Pseudoalteromonas viridis]RZM81116.1 dihydroneopterin triphosphate 2'-epimerase [Pseudoalteromonas rubra]
MHTAIINITNLRLRTFIGFNQEEREKKQDVVINIEIHYPADAECLFHDEVGHALNYKTITKAVIAKVEDGHFLLLEKLVADILTECHQHPDVSYAKVRVDKPHALRFADSVSLTLEWRKPA